MTIKELFEGNATYICAVIMPSALKEVYECEQKFYIVENFDLIKKITEKEALELYQHPASKKINRAAPHEFFPSVKLLQISVDSSVYHYQHPAGNFTFQRVNNQGVKIQRTKTIGENP